MLDSQQIIYAGPLAVRFIQRGSCDAPMHAHPESQLTIPVGQEAVQAHPQEKRRFRLQPRSYHLTLPEQPHRYQWSNPARLINLYFPLDALLALTEERKCSRIQVLWDQVTEDFRLWQLANRLAREFEYLGSPCPILFEAAGWQMLNALLGPASSKSANALPANIVDRVNDYIQANLSRALDLTALAQVSGYSPFHFSRAFARSVGLPPHKYVLCQRLRRARHLLSSREMGLKEVAEQTGFCSTSHFVDVFRRWTGVTPRQYRVSNAG